LFGGTLYEDSEAQTDSIDIIFKEYYRKIAGLTMDLEAEKEDRAEEVLGLTKTLGET
jgi:hypothetical protein